MARLSPALGLGPIREKLLAHPFGPSVDGLCPLILFGGEADHVHLVISIHPAFSILINTLKSSSSLRMRNRFADDHLANFMGKPSFWHRAYYVESVGGASLETVKRYV